MALNFRKATVMDLPAIMEIINAAVEQMLSEGRQQWDHSYPADVHIISDISGDCGYVLENNGAVVAYGAVVTDGEPAYDSIDGAWLSDIPYVALHRLAVAPASQSTGRGALFMRMVEKIASDNGFGSFRVDTNYDNRAMLRLLEKSGFAYCGKIRYDKGERLAFEKLI